ncbi:MAG: lipid-A-disaccharide synthase [Endomicrobium sp.]|uniref:lipid-A-disaccharide synthase n=1 Tax=Candidatus Endomicrobiellum pyrsonymphae TaxID=1408203 RepID=UPI0035743D83|nr:lipid-A-disaccharide synthase [Endomicrobium sp.]
MANDKIFISAGDLSGEIHASNLVREIKELIPSCHISAIGGNNLKLIADDFLEEIVSISAFGILRVKQALYLGKALKKLEEYFSKNCPDKIILVDYYGFHIHVAYLAKKMNIPVFYYISPQIWASRSGRVKKLAKTIKKMLVILPFEEKLYKSNGVDAVFVGNPLIDIVPEKQVFKNEKFGIANPPVIGLFPGSRRSTIKYHIPIILETAKILKEKINAKFIMFNADKKINCALPEYIDLDISGDFNKRKIIDFAICPSGTVSLENTIMGIPMVVMYKLSYFNYFFIRAIIKIKYITMVNILSGKGVVPEFIQFDATPKKIASSVLEQLKLENYVPKVTELLAFRKMLGTPGVSKRAAEIILNS